MKYIIIADTKEKMPWNFEFYQECACQISRHLDYGDYTVAGYEDLIVIERKRNMAEIANNVGKKKKQFEAEFNRMQSSKYRYLICECEQKNILSFPINSGIPRLYWPRLKMTGPLILDILNQLCEKYGVEPFFCCNRIQAEMKALELIKDVIKEPR